MPHDVPHLDGVLSAAEVARTAETIAEMMEPSGGIPWSPGEHVDVWNHVEGAMALLVGGQVEAAEKAYAWVPTVQRHDGSMPLKIVDGVVEDASGETNMTAYLAVGVWHHWLVRSEVEFVQEYWPTVKRALDFVVGMQLPFGGIAWSQEWHQGDDGELHPATINQDALLTGSSSIFHSLRAGLAIAELLGYPQPDWELAAGRLAHALRVHPEKFLDKSRWSMDWYYPVLGSAVRGERGHALIESRWDEFVVDGLGIRCVSDNDWVTGAETCELAMALDGLGDRELARTMLESMQHLRHENGSYWTGWVFDKNVYWPHEQTTYTAAAVVLAVDALAHATPGADIMRGVTFGPTIPDIHGECGCPGEASESVAGVAARAL